MYRISACYKAALVSRNDAEDLGHSIVDRDTISQDWKNRGFSCELWTDPPGQVWEDFTHAVDELVTLLEGEIEVEIEGKVFHPTLGEELFIPARALHSVRNIGTTTSRWLYGYKQ